MLGLPDFQQCIVHSALDPFEIRTGTNHNVFFNTGTAQLEFEIPTITVSESDTNPVMLCAELDLSSATGTSLGCDLTVTVSILDGTNAGTCIVVT